MLANALPAAGALILAGMNTNGHAAAPGALEFNRDIRPILSDKCFSCHGPDSGHRKAGLRLDRREDAIKPAKSGEIPIKPSDPSGSHIIERILSKESDEVMPPPEAKLPALTQAEVELLKKWIAAGAEYQPLWSFIPPKPVVLPQEPKNAKSPTHNGIDQLVAARLAKLTITPRPEARPETLLRRTSLDITGLPPSPAEVRAFLSDTAPDAYERAVDRLLASPAFGERMATDWLDVSRYADSYGFQVDTDREVWPWRDWVVSAFNRNLPFDQFVTWQLAGDLLPAPTEEQILATAFNRLHQQESEGGSVRNTAWNMSRTVCRPSAPHSLASHSSARNATTTNLIPSHKRTSIVYSPSLTTSTKQASIRSSAQATRQHRR